MRWPFDQRLLSPITMSLVELLAVLPVVLQQAATAGPVVAAILLAATIMFITSSITSTRRGLNFWLSKSLTQPDMEFLSGGFVRPMRFAAGLDLPHPTTEQFDCSALSTPVQHSECTSCNVRYLLWMTVSFLSEQGASIFLRDGGFASSAEALKIKRQPRVFWFQHRWKHILIFLRDKQANSQMFKNHCIVKCFWMTLRVSI